MRTGLRHFGLDKLEILAKDLICESININSLSHSFVHPGARLFHLFVLADRILQDRVHFFRVTLDDIKLIIRGCLLNFVENL